MGGIDRRAAPLLALNRVGPGDSRLRPQLARELAARSERTRLFVAKRSSNVGKRRAKSPAFRVDAPQLWAKTPKPSARATKKPRNHWDLRGIRLAEPVGFDPKETPSACAGSGQIPRKLSSFK